jgi:hypothetical protein
LNLSRPYTQSLDHVCCPSAHFTPKIASAGAEHSAGINGGNCYQLDHHLDQEARAQISYELGHGRIDVVSAYIGGRA